MEEEVIGKAAKRRRAKKDIASRRLVNTFAAQCENCYKWRVIDCQDEYEDIRSRMLEDLFSCEKIQLSCQEPADLDYDSSRTWVIDKPGLPKTPKGFKRTLVLRKDYSKMDAYYISPTGKKLRSRNEVSSYVEANPEFKDAPLGDFSFTVPKLMEDTFPPDAKFAFLTATAITTTVGSEKSLKSKRIRG